MVQDVTSYVYDAQNRVVATIEPDGSTNSVTYDAAGHQVATTDGLGRTASYVYDPRGNLVQTVYPDNTATASVYDAANQRIVSFDQLGRATTNVYDLLGRVTATLYTDGTSNTTAYDAAGRVAYTVDARGATNAFGYDAAGRRTSETNAWGTAIAMVTTNGYDADGNQTVTVDNLGRTNRYYFDALNRMTRSHLINGRRRRGERFGPPARREEGASPSGAVTNEQRSERPKDPPFWGIFLLPSLIPNGELHSLNAAADIYEMASDTTFPDGTTQLTAYDADGRKLSQTDQAGVTTTFGYDGLGRLTSVTNALSKVTTYAYDEAGNQTNQVDALLRTNVYVYDGLGRRIQHLLPGGQSERIGYDLAGNLLAHTNFNGLVITNGYDAMNRLKVRGTNGVTLEQYYYDNSGELTNRTDLSGNYLWVYDLRGRVTTNVAPAGTLYYSYDNNGNLGTLSSATSGGASVTYQYDALNRITNVVDNGLAGAQNTAYSFDGVGNLKTLKYPNGVTNLWQYDQLNRLTNLVWKSGSTPLGSFAYQLGPTGNRTNLSESLNGVSRTYAWSYDNTYRMTNETLSTSSPTGTIGYAFDAVGNRTSRASTVSVIGTQSPTYNTNDWLTTDSYDSDGNTTSSSGVAYLYDYADRLTNADSGSVSIVYDADGNRIKKVSSATTLYLVATVNPTGYPQVIEEKTVSGTSTNLAKVYTYGLALISQRVPGGTPSTNFFGLDGHGSTRFLTDAGGTVANAFVYDAYGILIASNTAPQTAYLYCGEQYDSDLGLYYLRARYYAPATGRFWTIDTYGGNQEDPLSLHKYLYCEANPIGLGDPSGDYSGPRQKAGYDAEQAIWDNYLDTHSVVQWPFIYFGSYQYYNASEYLKPDIFNKFEKTFLEIKPISQNGILDGPLKIILDELRFGPFYKPDLKWQPNPHELPTRSGDIIFAVNVGGVVYYQSIDDLETDLLIGVVVTTPRELLQFLKFSEIAEYAPALIRSLGLIRDAIPAIEADSIPIPDL